MDKLRIGITIGDINGIGPELIIRTLKDKRVSSQLYLSFMALLRLSHTIGT